MKKKEKYNEVRINENLSMLNEEETQKSSFFNCHFEYRCDIMLKLLLFLICIVILDSANVIINNKNSDIKKITNNSNINNISKKTEDNYENFVKTNLVSQGEVMPFSYFENISYKIDKINYTYSKNYTIVKIEYMLSIYDKQKNLIYPSDFRLYNGFHVSCFLEIYNNNKTIYSLAGIHENKYFKCIEFFKINELVKFGFIIYRINVKTSNYYTLYCSKDVIFNYSDSMHENDNIFDPKYIKKEYDDLVYQIIHNKSLGLKKYYILSPFANLKRYVSNHLNAWYFKNIFNNYFCFCVGINCLKNQSSQKCKYYFYMDVIEQNKNLYPKTDYLFVDFIFQELSSDDTFPVFQKMIEINYPAHYITNKKSINQQYCNNTKHCSTILNVDHFSYYFYGDFIEKYLTLILKLKAVVSCKESSFHYVSSLFYRIEYITYIAVGHGVCYFKDYLFEKNRIYGKNINNKILIPPSKMLLDVAKKYGWSDDNIIKLNLPRWDKYNEYNNEYFKSEGNITFTNNSLLVMFTWRYNKHNWNQNISSFYIKNITDILKNKKLNKVLAKKNITLYFSFHRYINQKYIKIYENLLKNKKHIKFINQNEISECLSKTSLIVSDFSSIVFDLMYRRKPFIIYVPDSNDKEAKKMYSKDYVYLIESMNKGLFQLENQCYNVNQTVEKIIYYVNNNFELDSTLIKFYKNFGFKNGNNIEKFINYLNIIN